MKRVLHVGTVCGRAGTETVLRYLIQGLAERGVESETFFEWDLGGSEEFRALCPTHLGPQERLTEVLRAGRFDVVHAISSTPTIGILEALEETGFTGGVVVGFHLDYVVGWNRTNVNFVVTPASWWTPLLNRFTDAPVRTISNPMDTVQFSPLEADERHPGPPIIAWIGRSADKLKNVERLKQLMSLLPEGAFQFHVADGNLQSSAEEVFGSQASKVTWYGRLQHSEMPAFYRRVAASRGMVLSTSDWEGLPMCVLEAMACGCPVVVPDAWGADQLIEHGKTGFVYHRAEGPAAIAQCVQALTRPACWEQVAAAARAQAIQQFSVAAVAAKYHELFQQAHAHGKSQRRGGRWSWALRSVGFYGRRLPVGISLQRPRRAIEGLDRAVNAWREGSHEQARAELLRSLRFYPPMYLKPWRAKFLIRVLLLDRSNV